MFNIGTGEMIVIAVVALLVLGPQRLPELARGIGKFVREFRRQTDDVRNVVEREFYRMDQEVMQPVNQALQTPVVQPAPDAVAIDPTHRLLPDDLHPPQPSAPPQQQEELQLQPPAHDESDAGHPDYHREEKPTEAPPTDTTTNPAQKAS